MRSDTNLVNEKVKDTSARPHSGIRLSDINGVVNDSKEENNDIKRNDIIIETVYNKEEVSIAGRGLSMPPHPDNNCEGAIDSVISRSLLIECQLYSNAGDEDSYTATHLPSTDPPPTTKY